MAKTVLLIDYEPKSISRIRRLLMESGYRTEIATDGLAGMQAFERIDPDLTLVQDLLPKKHGFEVCKGLKQGPQGRQAPVVIITAARNGRASELRLSGCDAHLSKPFEDQALMSMVRKHVRNGASQGESAPEPRSERKVVMPADAPLQEAGAAIAPAPIPVEFSEADIMSSLDAILPGSPLDGPAPERPETIPPVEVSATAETAPEVGNAVKVPPVRSKNGKKKKGIPTAKKKRSSRSAGGGTEKANGSTVRSRRRKKPAKASKRSRRGKARTEIPAAPA